jgi:Flp pilus assembly protein TadB
MTMNWSQQKYDCMPVAEREAGRYLRIRPKSLVIRPRKPKRDFRLTNMMKRKSHVAAGNGRRKKWSIGWAVTLAALAGAIIFYVLNASNTSILSSAVAVAAIMLAVCLSHFYLWRREFARRVVRNGQRDQDQARRSVETADFATSATIFGQNRDPSEEMAYPEDNLTSLRR